MAGPDLVSDMLRSAGYEHVAFARYDTDICIGRTLDEAVEFAVALGPAGEIIQLAGEGGELLRGQIICCAARDPFSLSAGRRHLGRFKHLVRHREESCALAIQDAVSSIADARSFAPGPTMPRYAQSK